MARVIHATTMNATIANPCCVAAGNESGANHIASGTMTQRTWPMTTRREFGSSSNVADGAVPLSTAVMKSLPARDDARASIVSRLTRRIKPDGTGQLGDKDG